MKTRVFSIGILFFGFSVCTFAQRFSINKPAIDSLAIGNWYDLGRSVATICANGKYFMYPIYNLPTGKQTLVIQSTHGPWKKEFIGAYPGVFSFDSKYAIFQSADTLVFLTLGSDNKEYVTGVSSFIFPYGKYNFSYNVKLVAYKLRQGNVLVLKDLAHERQLKIDSVSGFKLNQEGNVILVKKGDENSGLESLNWVDVGTSYTKTIWSNKDNTNISVLNYSFNHECSQVVFLTTDKNNDVNNIVWYYKPDMQMAEVKVSNRILHRTDGMFISREAPTFSENGKYVFFQVQSDDKLPVKTDTKGVQVDVWNYKDLVLQPLQAFFKNRNQEIPQYYIRTWFTASIEIDNNHVCQLENDTLKIVKSFNSDFVIVAPSQNVGDKDWLRYKAQDYYLMSLKDGSLKHLVTGEDIQFWLSPNKRFLVYFDSQLLKYCSYDLEKEITNNISASIAVKLTDDELDELVTPNVHPVKHKIAGWSDDGQLLIYDNHDIWMLDPSGKNVPENITSGYGRANNIRFDLISEQNLQSENTIYPTNKAVLLTTFYNNTKQTGFFKVAINKKQSPELLSLNSCLTYQPGLDDSKAKAESANIWIVKRQDMSDAPNFYSTSDFKTFKQLTDIQPQKKYRWGTTELVSWEIPDGKMNQGILYKPEDFDSNKKYPVIVNYYEKKSAELHKFLSPELFGGDLNIPWFFSREYLVFTPDVHYVVGKVAQSVVNSILPGIEKLIKLRYVDSLAIGIQGQSFGGYETNILVTESNLFAAAAEGAGPSDLISQYGSLLPTDRNDGSGVFHQEKGGQLRLNSTLWDDQRTYIENSPIFKADKVTTPLLIRHNKGDEAVPWGQAVEMFIALRRLDKPVWMLQYDGEGHGNMHRDTKMDYTIRLTQFFDHYLKGMPAPKWMTEGIPAKLKGIENGYELDPNGNCSDICPVCNKTKKISSTQ